MGERASTFLLGVALVAALVGCRTRLPVDRSVLAPSLAVAARPAAPSEVRGTSRWREVLEAEAPSGERPSPFRIVLEPDRLRDVVRLERRGDEPGGLFGFLFVARVCTPGHHWR